MVLLLLLLPLATGKLPLFCSSLVLRLGTARATSPAFAALLRPRLLLCLLMGARPIVWAPAAAVQVEHLQLLELLLVEGVVLVVVRIVPLLSNHRLRMKGGQWFIDSLVESRRQCSQVKVNEIRRDYDHEGGSGCVLLW